jgi:FAD/FMN-containing dehydrogenase
VVDLKNMQQVTVNQTTWIATIGAGALLGDITTELINQGNRAFAHGVCPQVGIGGHATIGGLGPASRMWGAALDHIHAVTVVTAEGSALRASQTENADLFWALRGAGASFGVITEFDMITHPPPSLAISYSFDFNFRPFTEFAAQPFKDWQKMIADPTLSRKLASEVVFSEAGMIISGMFYGSQAEFDALNLTAVFPTASNLKTVVFDSWAGAMGEWFENLALQISGGIPSWFYSKSAVFTPKDIIPDDGVDAMMTYLDTVEKGSLVWFGIFDLSGGQVVCIWLFFSSGY